MTALADALPDDVASLKAMLLSERARTDRLTQITKELQRHRFGRRAETLPFDQLELGLEDVQQVEAAVAAEAEATEPSAKAAKARQRRTNRGALPTRLPRFEIVVDVESTACPCCGVFSTAWEDVSERLDIIPAQIRPSSSSGRSRTWAASPARLIAWAFKRDAPQRRYGGWKAL